MAIHESAKTVLLAIFVGAVLGVIVNEETLS